MIVARLKEKIVIKEGSRKGQIMGVIPCLEEDKNKSMTDLMAEFVGHELVDMEDSTIYEILGISHVHYFLPDQPPSLGLLLKEKSKLVGEYDT